MIKKIVTDTHVLSQKCQPCFFMELDILKNRQIIENMIDTAKTNEPDCIGLAAIQIKEYRRIILIKIDGQWLSMLNPSFTPVRSAGMKQYKEGCLSFPDRIHRIKLRRFKKIKVSYQTVTGLPQKITLKATNSNIDAVIIQHEIDHLNGKLV